MSCDRGEVRQVANFGKHGAYFSDAMDVREDPRSLTPDERDVTAKRTASGGDEIMNEAMQKFDVKIIRGDKHQTSIDDAAPVSGESNRCLRSSARSRGPRNEA